MNVGVCPVSGTGLYAGTDGAIDIAGTFGGVADGVFLSAGVDSETETSCHDHDGARLACGGSGTDKKLVEERGSIAGILQDKVLLNGEILYVCSDQVQETTER
jgi:hypothetical protein